MSSMARVIFLVDWTLLIRRRRTRSWPLAISRAPLLARLRAGRLGLGAGLGAFLEVFLFALLLGLLGGLEALLEGVDRLGELVLVRQFLLVLDLIQQVAVATAELFEELRFEAAHVSGGDVVDEAAGTGEDRQHLLLDRHGRPQRLLEQFGEA